MAKITIKVTKTAFYNGRLVYPNEIIKGYDGACPSWATLAGGKEIGNDAPKNQQSQIPDGKKEGLDNVGQGEEEGTETGNENSEGEGTETGNENGEGLDNVGQGEEGEEGEVIVAGDGGVHVIPEDEAKLQEELEALLNEGIEKGIILEDADKKTIAEQVEEMKKLLGKE